MVPPAQENASLTDTVPEPLRVPLLKVNGALMARSPFAVRVAAPLRVMGLLMVDALARVSEPPVMSSRAALWHCRLLTESAPVSWRMVVLGLALMVTSSAAVGS